MLKEALLGLLACGRWSAAMGVVPDGRSKTCLSPQAVGPSAGPKLTVEPLFNGDVCTLGFVTADPATTFPLDSIP